MERDSVYLIWTNTETGKSYKVGKLYKENKKFYFKYIIENVKEAETAGFKLLVAFPSLNATYESPKLFANFASRLPDKRRPEIDKILQEYGMKEYDEFELLKRSRAKLPTDSYEFVR